MKKITVNTIDTYRSFDDKVTLYDYNTETGEAYRVIVTTLGAYDEDDNEVIGLGAVVEIYGNDRTDNPKMAEIYKHFTGRFEEVEMVEATDYNSYINTRDGVAITTYSSPDDVETITDEIKKLLERL